MLKKRFMSGILVMALSALMLFISACGSGGGGGNSSGSDGTTPASTTGRISGTILDAGSATPVAGATVSVYSGTSLLGTATTDANGRYSIEVAPGSGYTVEVSYPGYATSSQGNINVTANATTDLSYDLQPSATAQGTIDGVVRHADTQAGIAGATIEVYDGANLLGTTTTDADGILSLDVEAGTGFTVVVSSPGFIPASYYGVDVVDNETTILETILQIADTYVGDGTASGTITDSLAGTGIGDVAISLRQGLNRQTGPVVATGTTGGSGQYSLAGIPTGYYTAELSKAGYITAYILIYSRGGQDTANQNASISPVLAAGETRIVLTWGAAPDDLDSHLTVPTTSGPRFHLYYSDVSVNDGTVAQLDTDDTDSFGPETITISTQIAGVYRYSIYDFTNRASLSSTALSNSGAQVKVYQSTGLVATYNVPANVGGTVWAVFELSGTTITGLNILSYNTDETTIP